MILRTIETNRVIKPRATITRQISVKEDCLSTLAAPIMPITTNDIAAKFPKKLNLPTTIYTLKVSGKQNTLH